MKRIRFGAVLLALLLVLGIGGGAILERTWQIQAENLDKAARLAADGDWAGADALWEEARSQWERHPVWIAALFHHDLIDEIEGLFAQLEVFSAERRAVSFSSTCVYLSRQLESLGKSHSFNLENLL